MSRTRYDWSAMAADPRFIDLQRRKRRFLAALMAFAVISYFLLPVGAAYFPSLFAWRIVGQVNVGIVFALAQFAITLAVAVVYVRRADRDFDRATDEIVRDAQHTYRKAA